MPRIGRLALVVLVCIGLGLAWPLPPPAFACTPPPGGLPHITTAERTNAAEIVLEGTVVDGTNQQGEPEYPLLVVKVQVLQYLKGGGPAIITIDGFGQGSLCLAEARIGDHLSFTRPEIRGSSSTRIT